MMKTFFQHLQTIVSLKYSFFNEQLAFNVIFLKLSEFLGCAPTNVDGDNYLKPGERTFQHDFVFSCEEGEDGVLNYEAIACIDTQGEIMHPGETRSLSNGTVILHCNLYGGALKKVVERGKL